MLFSQQQVASVSFWSLFTPGAPLKRPRNPLRGQGSPLGAEGNPFEFFALFTISSSSLNHPQPSYESQKMPREKIDPDPKPYPGRTPHSNHSNMMMLTNTFIQGGLFLLQNVKTNTIIATNNDNNNDTTTTNNNNNNSST